MLSKTTRLGTQTNSFSSKGEENKKKNIKLHLNSFIKWHYTVFSIFSECVNASVMLPRSDIRAKI